MAQTTLVKEEKPVRGVTSGMLSGGRLLGLKAAKILRIVVYSLQRYVLRGK